MPLQDPFVVAALYWVGAAWTVTAWHASVKKAGAAGFTLQQQLVLRFIGAGLFTLLAGWLHTGSLAFVSTRAPGLQLVRSVCLACMTWGVFIGARYLALAQLTALLFSWPALGQIIGVVSFHETLTIRSVLSITLCLLGVVLLAQARGGSADKPLSVRGVLAALAAAAASGYLAHLNAQARQAGDSDLTSLLYMCAAGAVLVAAWSGITPPGRWPRRTWRNMALAAAVVALGVGLQWLYIEAAERAPVSQLMPLTYIFQLPFSVTLGRYFLKDAWPSRSELRAYAVIIGGALLKYAFPSLGM